MFYPIKHLEQLPSRKEQAIHQLRLWSFSIKDQKIISSILDEWYTSRTLNTVLQQWENIDTTSLDISGLSEAVRIIDIYWLTSRQRDLDDSQ